MTSDNVSYVLGSLGLHSRRLAFGRPPGKYVSSNSDMTEAEVAFALTVEMRVSEWTVVGCGIGSRSIELGQLMITAAPRRNAARTAASRRIRSSSSKGSGVYLRNDSVASRTRYTGSQ